MTPKAEKRRRQDLHKILGNAERFAIANKVHRLARKNVRICCPKARLKVAIRSKFKTTGEFLEFNALDSREIILNSGLQSSFSINHKCSLLR